MEISKEFIPYKEAFDLEKIGFNEPCLGRYCVFAEFEKPTSKVALQKLDCSIHESLWLTKAPLYQQAFRWFREKYGWTIKINKIVKDTWSFSLENFTIERELFGGRFSSYEEAELECLKKLIEIVKNK